MAVNDATCRPHAGLVSCVLQRLWVQLRQEEDVAASLRKTAETAFDGGRDRILHLARQTVANALACDVTSRTCTCRTFVGPTRP